MSDRRRRSSLYGFRVSTLPSAKPASNVRLDVVFTRVAIAAAVIAVLRAAQFISTIPDLSASIGVDYQIYMSAATRWLHGETYFFAFQLAGPYHIIGGEVLYPPVILWLLVPFTFLPAVLWWFVPVVLTLAAVRRMRSKPLGWAVAAFIMVLPIAQEPILWGNPVMWLVPAVAWGLFLGWPAAAVVVKPTLLPFLLAGLVRPRALVLGLIAMALLSLPFGIQVSLDWIMAIQNSDLPLTYSIRQFGLLLVPVVLYLSGEASVETRARLTSWLRMRGVALGMVARRSEAQTLPNKR
jgi:hypothetical protein